MQALVHSGPRCCYRQLIHMLHAPTLTHTHLLKAHRAVMQALVHSTYE